MTRFARAKGSKASNERREEEATPWHVMRQQLAEQLNNYYAQSDSNTTYNLKEILRKGDTQQHEEVWSDFGEAKSNLKKKLKTSRENNNNEGCKIKKPKINNHVEVRDFSRGDGSEVGSNRKQMFEETSEAGEKRTSNEGKQKKETPLHQNKKVRVLKKLSKTNVDSGSTKLSNENIKTTHGFTIKRKVEDEGDKKEVNSNNKKKKLKNNEVESIEFGTRKQKKNKRINGKNIFVVTSITPKKDIQSSLENTNSTLKNVESSIKSEKPETVNKKIKKKVQSSTGTTAEEKSEDRFDKSHENSTNTFNNNLHTDEKSSEVYKNGNIQPKKKKQLNHLENNSRIYNYSGNYNTQNNNFPKYYNEKSSQTIIANGREIHVVRYDGFFVKKEDAVELKNLRKKLLDQKIPKEKLKVIMKLERRKAEKALAREKKKVCYHCRQFGHNFSDCPEIKDSDMVKTGVCFKCGSLEHSHFECKVLQRQEFRHAVCFVCKEQGHIARQCPLNSQGQYPKGGSCHLCGEVTHLRKDCPKAVEEKTSKSVTVDTLKGDRVEDIGGKILQQKEIETRKKKVINFK